MFLKKYLTAAIILICMGSCGKKFLEAKQIKNQNIPQTVADYYLFVNLDFYDAAAYTLSDNAIDEFEIPEAQWNVLGTSAYEHVRGYYSWRTDLDMSRYETMPDWHAPYYVIYYANMALDGLSAIQPQSNETELYNKTKGIALFLRGYWYYQLARTFVPPYDAGSDSPYGLPLRLHSEVTAIVGRSTVHQTYKQIISDLKESIPLLPMNPNREENKPGKAAAYAVLAKTYLSMENYEMAAAYADSCLQINNHLLDFNTLDAENPATQHLSVFPNDFGRSNPEILYTLTFSNLGATSIFNRSSQNIVIPAASYDLFDENDLRRAVNFRLLSTANPVLVYRGSYINQANVSFVGLTTSECYLISAEGHIRTGNIDRALELINQLRENRYKSGTYTNVSETDPEALLRFVLEERRRELFNRGARWEDLRRLNKDPRFAVTLTRDIAGNYFELPPNDPRYTFPIPLSEIDAAGIMQNPR